MMRQRLIGALVLLCLGVILWSVLLTGSVDHRVDRTTQIPSPPQIEPVLEQSPQVPDGVPSVADGKVPPQPTLPPEDGGGGSEESPAPQGGEGVRAAAEPPPPPDGGAEPSSSPQHSVAEQAPASAPPTPEPAAEAPPVKPGLDERGLPGSWVVQVGSFGNQANAEALVEKLRSRGYKAFSDEFRSGGRLLHRVQVGPVVDERRARSLKGEIDKGFGVKSIVNRFEG